MKKVLVFAITALFAFSVSAQEMKLKEEKAVAAPAEVKEEKKGDNAEKKEEKKNTKSSKKAAKSAKKEETKKEEPRSKVK